jgi:DNA-binding MarR family transcriptional regulator
MKPPAPPNPHAPIDMGYLLGTVGYSIRRAQLAVFQDIYRAFGDAGITLAQFSVLAVAADNPEITQSQLAAVLAVERPRIVPLIDALQARGLAQRLVCDQDRRNRRIVLTPEGRQLLRRLKRQFAQHEARLLKMLGQDKASLLASLHTLAQL